MEPMNHSMENVNYAIKTVKHVFHIQDVLRVQILIS